MRNFFLTMLVLVAACAGKREASPERRAEVAQRGAQVMPFDLTKTHHVFEDTEDGGVQTVTANEVTDTLQVRLIREHLTLEASRFAHGGFDDPMAIHGMTMPGLAELKSGASRISVAYSELPAGAVIRYKASDPALVAALHRWFDAQRMDHGT
jgi:hypothetical protein